MFWMSSVVNQFAITVEILPLKNQIVFDSYNVAVIRDANAERASNAIEKGGDRFDDSFVDNPFRDLRFERGPS